MSSAYTKITFDDSAYGITAKKLNLLTDDLSAAIAAGGGGTSTGDMLKSVYDTNNNGKVDTCDSLPWGSVTGKPATFPPDSTAMLKSVYDVNADNIVDHAALADAAPWTGISGAPAVPAPSSTTPAMDGTAAIGVGMTYARNDHVHPSDTSRYAASNPSGYISANQTITLSGDATGSGATAIATTLATVNANVGTFQGLTVNAKGLVTGASNQNYVQNTRQVLTSQSLTGGGDLSADRTLTLVGDSAAPGNSMFYGTNASGVRGWLAQPTGTVNPGTWTNLSYGTGWTQNTTAQFRVEVNGSFSTVICQGIINYASGAASLAFTLPAGARPAVTRGCVLAGFDSSGDTQLFQASISTGGAVTITPMVRQAFSWPSATNGSLYLDGLTFAL